MLTTALAAIALLKEILLLTPSNKKTDACHTNKVGQASVLN
jgi:hypothetical protein